MITFLFWNLQQKPIEEIIGRLVVEHEVDVLMLAENRISAERLLLTLNRTPNTLFDYASSIGCEKIHIFTRFSRHFINPVLEDNRLTIRHMTLPGSNPILLSVVHFPSKKNWKGSSQTAESFELAQSIRKAESLVGHSRTILVGDLNMNPFEEGLVNANGLHGVMTRQIASRRTRTVQEREYPFFYNPMWNFLGDAGLSPPGTYYYASSEHTSYFWHMFDQVLIRPDLLSNFDIANLRIITSDGKGSLLLFKLDI